MKKTLEGLLGEAEALRHGAKTELAIRRYLEAAHLAKESGEFLHAAQALQLAGVAARQAVNRADSTKLRDAVSYLQAAEALYQEAGESRELGNLYRDLAVTYDCAGLRSDALKYFQRSIELLEKNNGGAALALTYAKFGRHFYRKNDFATARQYFDKALGLFQQFPNQGYYMSTTWLDYGRTLAKAGQAEEATEWAEQSLSWYEADHDQEHYDRRRAQLYGLLSLLYDRMGREKLAKNYARRFEKLLRGFDPAAAQVARDELRSTFDNER